MDMTYFLGSKCIKSVGFVVAMASMGVMSASVYAEQPVKNTANATKNTINAVPAKTLQTIKLRANNVINFYKKSDAKFGKNEVSVQALERIAYLHLLKQRTAIQHNNFIQSYGAFYGETLIELFGGRWVYFNDALAIQGNNGVVAYPYASVRSRLTNNQPNSIYREMMAYKQLTSMSKADFAKQMAASKK